MAILPYFFSKNVQIHDGKHAIDLEKNARREADDYYNNISLFMVKPICAILLHINMQPKVKQAIARLIYLMQHPVNFDND